jgi:hypothetical protein
MFDIYDLFQDGRIAQASGEAANARSAARRADSAEQRLESEVETLKLACAAMWSLLSERCGVTGDDLADRMQQIDLRDGRLDGRITPEVARCDKCRRPMSARHNHCMYCGHAHLHRVPFPDAG